jgi:RNA-directed DNA polymerase
VYDADLAGYFDSIPHDKLMACVRMRVVDGAVLRLIRQWLRAPVVEPPTKDGGPPKIGRNERGTPQGGVLSPLLANIYLHWFDHVFERKDGPAGWAAAKLTRYADDFVVQARYVGTRLREWIEGRLEGWLGLKINREKTRVIQVHEPGKSLDFLGYTFRKDRDLQGQPWRYWNLEPSRKALAKERETLRSLINAQQCHTPLPELIERVNRHRRGWANYFQLGYPRKAMRQMNRFVVERLTKHLHRRSQRGWRPRQGVSARDHLIHLGLVIL